MRYMNALAIAALATTVASPAFAQMKTSAPSKSAPAAKAAVAAGGRAVASGDDQFRRTNIGGVERAQVQGDGNAVMGFTSLSVGMGNNLEVGLTGPFGVSLNPGFGLGTPNFYGKMILVDAGALSVAVGGNVGLSFNSAGSTFNLPLGVSLPVSFWALGPGNLHVVPGFGVTLNNAGNAVSPRLDLAYELPLMSRWTLVISDTANFAGATTNSLNVGSRVALTPNLTADVGGVSFNGTTLTVTALSVGGTFGGKVGDLQKMWGL
ncbi:hypothetical protein J7643_19285 [bacterium]|nr:hypothetical protein [bacterium]